jgi:anti-sigma B factor antagonist
VSAAGDRLEIETVLLNGLPVVRVRGEVDLRSSPHLRDAVLEAGSARPRRLIVDLSQVGHMDSSGVGTLVYLKRELERAGGKIVLAGLQERVRSVLEITQLERFFTIAATVDEAARS